MECLKVDKVDLSAKTCHTVVILFTLNVIVSITLGCSTLTRLSSNFTLILSIAGEQTERVCAAVCI